MELDSMGKISTLLASIRLEWKQMPVTNTLALYNTELITAVKSFKVQARVESFAKLDSAGKIPALLTNIRLGWKQTPVTNSLAYYDTELITAVKKFKVQAKRSPLQRFILS